MDVHVFSLPNGRYDSTDVLTVLDDRIADAEVLKRDLMPDGHSLLEDTPKRRVVRGHDAQQVGSGNQILNHHDSDIVAAIMHQQMWLIVHARTWGSAPCA
jgi:hypothetical protein